MQAKRLDSEKKLQEMMDQMRQLQVEKEELELKNRILTRDLSAWQDHLEEMWGNKVTCLFPGGRGRRMCADCVLGSAFNETKHASQSHEVFIVCPEQMRHPLGKQKHDLSDI